MEKKKGVSKWKERESERERHYRKKNREQARERKTEHRNGFIPVLQILDASELGQPAPRS